MRREKNTIPCLLFYFSFPHRVPWRSIDKKCKSNAISSSSSPLFRGGKRKIESWVCFFFPSPFSSHRFVPMSHDSEWVIGGGEEREGSLDREGGGS